jgi:hypothetical protein
LRERKKKMAKKLISVFIALFIISSVSVVSAQQLPYLPVYTEYDLEDVQDYVDWMPVYLDNKTGGSLELKLEVNGESWIVKLGPNAGTRDLMVPEWCEFKVVHAKYWVPGDKARDAKYNKVSAPRRDVETGLLQHGWTFEAR